jgi:hypothetical protein
LVATRKLFAISVKTLRIGLWLFRICSWKPQEGFNLCLLWPLLAAEWQWTDWILSQVSLSLIHQILSSWWVMRCVKQNSRPSWLHGSILPEPDQRHLCGYQLGRSHGSGVHGGLYRS